MNTADKPLNSTAFLRVFNMLNLVNNIIIRKLL